MDIDGREAVIEVVDDGSHRDRPPRAGHDGHGLIGMRERAKQIGGTLSIQSTNGSGTEVVADVPISS